MRFLFPHSAFLILTLSSLQAIPVTVNWPENTLGTYNMPGFMPKPVNESGTYDLPEGKNIRVVGAGFDFNFVLEKGKAKFPFGLPKEKSGVQFDAATNTFSFITVDIQTDVKNCDLDVMVDGPATASGDDAPAGGEYHYYKLVYGRHQLLFAGNRQEFKVDEKGTVLIQGAVPQITAKGSTISVEGISLEVEPIPADGKWSISKLNTKGTTGKSTVHLLPGAYVYQAKGGAPFVVTPDGLLAANANAPGAEVLSLKTEDGTELGKIRIPNGEARQQERLQKLAASQQIKEQILKKSDSAKWKYDIALDEKMGLFDFPEEQLNYQIELPAGIKPADLKLISLSESSAELLPFQLSQLKEKDGVTQATLSFRTNLPKKAKLLFRLAANVDTEGLTAPAAQSLKLETKAAHEAVLGNGLLLVKVPAGHVEYPGGIALSKAPAPIIGLARQAQPEPWMAVGSFSAPDTVKVTSVDGKIVENGPVFATYEVSYQLEGGKNYTARLELRAGEPQVRVGETLHGLTREDEAFLKIDYSKSLNPNHRFVASNSGYDLFSGDYDREAKDGRLNFCLGLFTPNGLGVMRTATFFNDTGSDALMLSMDRMRDWKTEKRALWSSAGASENIRFYSRDGQKYLTAGLTGQERHWVIGLIPREALTFTTLPGVRAQAVGPEIRLFNQLTLWSLNAYKDRLPNWDEKLDTGIFAHEDFVDFLYDKPWLKLSYDDYVKKFFDNYTYTRDVLTFSSAFGGYSDRALPAFYADYVLSRGDWTPEQRESMRLLLLTLADYAEGDDNQPHHSMLSGHPNFVMDTKQAIPYAIGAFPNHPRAKAWRDSYMEFYNEWLDKYSRKDVPEANSKGGRWTENIACYVGQCFSGLLPDQMLLKAYDGTSLGKNPQMLMVIRWMRDSFMSPHDGVRMIPPQGAHSHAFNPDRNFWKVFFQLCAQFRDDDPKLADEMLWIKTNGKEGTKPDVRSALFTDYGPVLHYDFGGPHESYAHMQNIFGISYRWSAAGIIYYGAKGKVWSYNNMETNGDNFDWNSVSAFNVKGQGLTPGPTDQLLYDFDFAQFYRQPGADEANYKARGLMLVRDDYLVLSDEVKTPEIPGTFNWVNIYDLPQIYQLKPGATSVDKTARDPQPPRPENPDRIGKVRSYSGKGDFLTVVAPSEVKAEAKPFGATVNGEYVFASQSPTELKEGPAVFAGTYGYARANQLALFQGTKIGLNGFEIRRDGGDFGVSAAFDQGAIKGRLVGRSGGKVSIVPPSGFNAGKANVTIDGKPVAHTMEQGAITFAVEIAQRDGLKNYEIR